MIVRDVQTERGAGKRSPEGPNALPALFALTALLLLGMPPVAAQPAPDRAPRPQQELAFVCGGGPCPAPGALPLPDTVGEIVLENLDAHTSVTPYLHRKSWPNLRSDRDILASIRTPGMSPEATALALWEFVRTWRFSCPPYSQESQQLHDPVKLVNIFGCGLCDDTNAALVTLARMAEIPARLWGLGGHVVAEVAYEGGWHMLDAADGVYFRDEKGAIAGVETLARRPGLVASPTNRALRRRSVLRMAELIAHGAGPVAEGHRAAVQAHFAGLFSGFMERRGEARRAAAPADPADLDRIVFARYAEIVQSTADNAVSDWWNTAGSDHTMALALHPGDRLVYTLRPVGEAGMSCYLGAEECFDAMGELDRSTLEPLVQPVPEGRQPVVAERLPYAVEGFALDGSALPPGVEFDVFLALDGQTWSPLGALGGSGASGARASPASGRDLLRRLEYTFPPQAEPRFVYILKLVHRGPGGEIPLGGLKLSTRFRVAAKSLPWPSPGGSPVIVDATLENRPPAFAGLRVRFRRPG